MKKILKYIGMGFGGLVVLLVVVGLFLPREWSVERSVVINAPSERIHPFIVKLPAWQEWAAWNKGMDPDVKYEYSGPAEGVGATWSWNGPKMGKGKMIITSADPAKGITVDEAIETDEINAHGAFAYAAEGAGTRVTWTDRGTLPPVIGGYFRGQINDMLGEHFQTGLTKLKEVVEKAP